MYCEIVVCHQMHSSHIGLRYAFDLSLVRVNKMTIQDCTENLIEHIEDEALSTFVSHFPFVKLLRPQSKWRRTT